VVHNSDWLPSRREFQLAMAKSWESVLETKGGAWNIEDKEISELSELIDKAEKILNKASFSERSTIVTAQCEEIFDRMTAFMQDLKTRCFLSPPLTADDFISLELKPKSGIRTSIPLPSGQAEAEVSYLDAHLLSLSIRPLPGTVIDSRNVHGFRIFYGILFPSGAVVEQATGSIKYLTEPPKSGDDLPYSKFTRRKEELFDFNAGDSGRTVYFCIHYENSNGQAGSWGPIFHATIP